MTNKAFFLFASSLGALYVNNTLAEQITIPEYDCDGENFNVLKLAEKYNFYPTDAKTLKMVIEDKYFVDTMGCFPKSIYDFVGRYIVQPNKVDKGFLDIDDLY